MSDVAAMLSHIDGQRQSMHALLLELAAINSGTFNLPGLAAVADVLRRELAARFAQPAMIDLPAREIIDNQGRPQSQRVGQAISLARAATEGAKSEGRGARGEGRGSPRVLLNIHYDTVYPADHAFQSCTQPDPLALRGPGVADAKGGIVVLLAALSAFEASPRAGGLSWEILLNPDEEIGSPCSIGLLRQAAERNDVGLLFEPALPDGALVSARKGSGTFSLVVRGKAAHVGRNFADGRNAIHALAEEVVRLSAVVEFSPKESVGPTLPQPLPKREGSRSNPTSASSPGIILNVARIDGGGPANVVPDLAIARINARAATREEMQFIEGQLAESVARINQREGFRAELHGSFTSPPKPLDPATLALLQQYQVCAKDVGVDISWRDTGGASDGNKLAAAGLPNIDSLGPVGGSLHSDQEYIRLDSLVERAKLAALMLMRLAEHGLAAT